MRRMRRNELLRSLVQETRLSPKNFIYPLFVCPGSGVKREIASMPGNFQYSVDRIGEECREVASLGIPAVLLFGIPEAKDHPHRETQRTLLAQREARRFVLLQRPGLAAGCK